MVVGSSPPIGSAGSSAEAQDAGSAVVRQFCIKTVDKSGIRMEELIFSETKELKHFCRIAVRRNLDFVSIGGCPRAKITFYGRVGKISGVESDNIC